MKTLPQLLIVDSPYFLSFLMRRALKKHVFPERFPHLLHPQFTGSKARTGSRLWAVSKARPSFLGGLRIDDQFGRQRHPIIDQRPFQRNIAADDVQSYRFRISLRPAYVRWRASHLVRHDLGCLVVNKNDIRECTADVYRYASHWLTIFLRLEFSGEYLSPDRQHFHHSFEVFFL
jgi:hypothetical protein